MVSYADQAAAESKHNTDELIDDLDKAFRPSTQPLLLGGKPDKKVVPSEEDDGEVIDHDEAHRVFRSPRPSLTLEDIQQLQDLRKGEPRKHPGDGASGQGTTSDSTMRGGGIVGGSPSDDMWLAHKRDLGGDPGAALDAEEAHQAWEEAAREKYEEEVDSWTGCVFSDSETEDSTSSDCVL